MSNEKAEGIWNPYYAEILDMVARGEDPTEEMGRLRKTYAYAIPNLTAVQIVKAIGKPILEVGAGSGYWAAVLDKAGASVLATDNGDWTPFRKQWYPVKAIDAAEAAKKYHTRALMMVWPPYQHPMAADALQAYLDAGGDTLVYVGFASHHGATADKRFFDMLPEKAAFTVEIPKFEGNQDQLYVYLF